MNLVGRRLIVILIYASLSMSRNRNCLPIAGSNAASAGEVARPPEGSSHFSVNLADRAGGARRALLRARR